MFLLGAFCRDGSLDGDSAREEGFLGALDGGGDVRVERCLACSSAILESIAPLRRYSGIRHRCWVSESVLLETWCFSPVWQHSAGIPIYCVF